MRFIVLAALIAVVVVQLADGQSANTRRQLTPQERQRQMIILQRRRLAAQQAAQKKQAAKQAAQQNAAQNTRKTQSEVSPNINSKKTATSIAGPPTTDKKKNMKRFKGEIQEIPVDSKITDIPDEDFNAFLKDEKSVRILVQCFLQLNKCPYSSIRNLLLQVRTLGVGAKCETCTEEEQEDLNNKLYRFIFIFQTKYRSYWRQLLPHLGFILGTSKKRPSL